HERVLRFGEGVELDPLAQDAALAELLPADLVELPGEKARDPGEPRVGRLGEDEVVLLVGALEMAAPVVEDDPEVGVPVGPMVDAREVLRRGEDRGLDLAAGELRAGEEEARAGGRAAAVADDEDVLRL